MSEASFASLGPTLLARKGGAKPAMRPQLAPLPGVVAPEADELEDLGWNDMGGEPGVDSDAGDDSESRDNIVAIKPAHSSRTFGTAANAAEGGLIEDRLPHGGANDTASSGPLIHCRQQDLADRILREHGASRLAAKSPQPVTPPVTQPPTAKRKAAASKNARRAAFTLRLDADRHLKLRLAATMRDVSAQALVTQALDDLLADIADLDALAEQMKRG
ncbi:hypothetical protein [Erythrobacter sp.]|jgi:hypothetical protein|uniref:hypothetical protein n=1 Tax=Erythrobacter sp. TaxID=1042 RepID=UPI002EA03675|nr:hypothetical protein [Erythrobacter sp.]